MVLDAEIVKSIAFRADAGREIGNGHFLRCLSLAGAVKSRGCRTRFLSRGLASGLAELAHAQGHEVVDLPAADRQWEPSGDLYRDWLRVTIEEEIAQCQGALADHRWDWIVVDHYGLDAVWHDAMRNSVRQVMAIDDLANRDLHCDLLLDQNFYRDAADRYRSRVDAKCRQLFGPKYALLRPEFAAARTHASVRQGPVRRLLVFMGGTDAPNYTQRALDGIARIENRSFEVDVLMSAQHAHLETVLQTCERHQFQPHVQSQRVAELMASADLAIGAGGSAAWERCCVGVPTIACVIADNQRVVTEEAALGGYVIAPQWGDDFADQIARQVMTLVENPSLRQALSERGLRLVDGLGTTRVVRAMGITDLVLRNATIDDSENLYRWRNHPTIRAMSKTQNAFTYESHCQWLQRVLVDEQRVLLIGELDGEPVGVVRFDITQQAEPTAEISIYRTPEVQRAGIGSELLAAAETWLAEHRPEVLTIHAEILGHNPVSRQMFESQGYRLSCSAYTKTLH